MSLIDRIQQAQVRAGENAVVASLQRQGLATGGDPFVIDAGRVLQAACFTASATAGWWGAVTSDRESNEINIDALEVRSNSRIGKLLTSQKIALAHSELSEALEGERKDKMDEHLPHRKSCEVELADAVIRIFDLAGAKGYDLGAAIAEKMAYNAQREDHKLEVRATTGGKAF